jgi:hypothetical protein
MNPMRRPLARLLAAALLGTLAACGGGTGPGADPERPVFDALSARLGLGGGEEAPDAREVLTPARIARARTPVILLVVEATDTGLTLIPAAANRGTVQWRDVSGGGLLRRDGILVGTRGFGFDLHTADVAPLAAALRAGGGRGVERVNRYIDGQNRIVAVQYLCSVTPLRRETLDIYGRAFATTVYEEACIGDGPGFVNEYWLDAGGTVRRSRELIHPESGVARIDLLRE